MKLSRIELRELRRRLGRILQRHRKRHFRSSRLACAGSGLDWAAFRMREAGHRDMTIGLLLTHCRTIKADPVEVLSDLVSELKGA